MRKTCLFLAVALTLSVSAIFSASTSAAPYSFYQLTEITAVWDGTDADRLKEPSANYDYTYGDEESITYMLPWPIIFYGQTYNQVTADTNGNIWFGVAGSAHSFNLAVTGRGPVVAAWNNDLNSRHYGGVFVQRKTSPERVVVEWQTETFTDGASQRISNFEAVIFQNSDIRIDYKNFNPSVGKDFGSGISKSNNLNYINLTTSHGNAFTLADRSFIFTTIPPALNITFSGSGNGIITSAPPGIACDTDCSATFPVGTQVTLLPEASQYSLFTGWTGGPCSGTGDCLTMLLADAATTAVFDRNFAQQVLIDGTAPSYHTTIQGAYNAAADTSVIKLWALSYDESLLCNRPVEITLKGGYNSSYTDIIDEVVLNGTLTISDGVVITDGLGIR